MLRRFLAVLAILATVPAGAGVVCSSTNKSCGGGSGSGTPILEYTVATLPDSHIISIVTDGASSNDCTVGGGSTRVLCSWNGSAWVATGDGDSGAAPTFDAVGTGTNTTATMTVGTGGSIVASGSGSIAATTADALAADPTDCGAGQKATGIAANGDLTCSAVDQTADITGTTPVDNGGTGVATTTAYSPVWTGTTATGAWKVDLGPGSSGECLLSGGAGAYPTWGSCGAGGGAPTDATYITQTANGSLSAEQALGALATGCLGSATTTGVVSAVTITGTSNEIAVANGDCSGTPTLSLPATIDLGGKTSFEIPNGAAPTTNAFGQIAGDNDAWAASRGAPQWFDGTANTYLIGALASDTPTNGQVPTWNTGGTITWETPSAASGITLLCKGAPAAATTGTTEEVLATCSMSAGLLTTSGHAIRINFFGHTAANANNKAVSVRVGGIGGTVVATFAAISLNDQMIVAAKPITVSYLSSTTATAIGEIARQPTGGTSFAVLGGHAYNDLSITWANALDVVITATTVSAAGDFTLDTYQVELIK